MRGYKSKETSLKKVAKKLMPSMILLNETLLTGKTKVSMSPFMWWSKNRTDKGGGGIASAVSQQYKHCTVGAGEGAETDEYIISRLECFKPALNVINCYGEQRKTPKEQVEKKWLRITKDMKGIRARGELCLLAGDLNKHVGRGELGVPDNTRDVSLGGHLLRDLLGSRNWTLVNGMGKEVVRGGPFTRKDPATNQMSCLDLFIVSSNLLPYVKELVIDSERKFAVSRAVKQGNSYKQVYSDHFSCFLTLTDLPRVRERREEDRVVWNLGKEGGWDKYKELTDKYSEALQEAVDNEECMDTKMEAFEKIHDRIKYKSFGKVRIGTKYKDKKEERTRDNEERSNEAKELFEEEDFMYFLFCFVNAITGKLTTTKSKTTIDIFVL